jgi:TrmH family RNA methyltransferase
MSSFADSVRIVLVEPLYGGNLGSVARVMANFGLTRLSLVNPAPGIFDDPRLEPMARAGALPILQSVRVHATLDEALDGVELALGFTTRLGKKRRDGYDLRPAVDKLLSEGPTGPVAAVFGSEDRGLKTEDVEKCHWLVRVATDEAFPSLNLAQAVGLFCYELTASAAQRDARTPAPRRVATVGELEGLYDHLERVLQEIGFIEESTPDRMMNHMRRMISRRLPDPRDVRILRGILSKVEWSIEKAKNPR